jgi:hypothetical protein
MEELGVRGFSFENPLNFDSKHNLRFIIPFPDVKTTLQTDSVKKNYLAAAQGRKDITIGGLDLR